MPALALGCLRHWSSPASLRWPTHALKRDPDTVCNEIPLWGYLNDGTALPQFIRAFEALQKRVRYLGGDFGKT